jgi:hypothetical protein
MRYKVFAFVALASVYKVYLPTHCLSLDQCKQIQVLKIIIFSTSSLGMKKFYIFLQFQNLSINEGNLFFLFVSLRSPKPERPNHVLRTV